MSLMRIFFIVILGLCAFQSGNSFPSMMHIIYSCIFSWAISSSVFSLFIWNSLPGISVLLDLSFSFIYLFDVLSMSFALD